MIRSVMSVIPTNLPVIPVIIMVRPPAGAAEAALVVHATACPVAAQVILSVASNVPVTAAAMPLTSRFAGAVKVTVSFAAKMTERVKAKVAVPVHPTIALPAAKVRVPAASVAVTAKVIVLEVVMATPAAVDELSTVIKPAALGAAVA